MIIIRMDRIMTNEIAEDLTVINDAGKRVNERAQCITPIVTYQLHISIFS